MTDAPVQERSRLLRPSVVVPWAVALVNLVLRLPRLAKPSVLVFDEVFYVPDASDLLRWGIEQGRPKHPPLGKWMIAAGIRVFGYTPFGWRIAAVLAGCAIAGLVASAGLKLTRRWELGALAGMLVGLDGIMFVMSRTGMLDIFVGLFVVIAAWCACSAWMAQPDHGKVRQYGLGAAVAIGFGGGVKWSALYCLPVLVAELVILDIRLTDRGARRFRAVAGTGTTWLVLPAVLYVAAFAPTFLTNPDQLSPASFVDHQRTLLTFHEDLRPKNPYARSAGTWVFQTHPAALYRQGCKPSQAGHSVTCPHRSTAAEIRVLAVANPVVWAVSIMAGLALLGIAIWKRAVFPALLVALGLSEFVPWLFTRPPYSFYETALVPLMVLWVPLALLSVPRRPARLVAGAIGVAVLAMFVFLYPLWTAVPLSRSSYADRQLVATWP